MQGDTADSWGQWPHHSTSVNLSPFARAKKEDKKERATVWCPLRFSITHSKTTSPPESEDEFKVAKSKSISGSHLSAVPPQGSCTEVVLWLWTEGPHSARPARLAVLSFRQRSCCWSKAARITPGDCYVAQTPPSLSLQRSFTYSVNSSFSHVFFFFFSPASSVQKSNTRR